MTDQEFINLWKQSESPHEVAKVLDSSYWAVVGRAYRLRKAGYVVPKMTDKFDKAHYAKIGAIGGRNGRTGGFAADRELARRAGAIGGRVSRRNKRND